MLAIRLSFQTVLLTSVATLSVLPFLGQNSLTTKTAMTLDTMKLSMTLSGHPSLLYTVMRVKHSQPLMLAIEE